MICSTPGFLVVHYFLEFIQIHVYWVSDAIQPLHPLPVLLPSSLPALNLSQDQGLFKWVSSLHQVAKVLEFQLRNLALFYVWEDVRVWAHWNHSFHIHQSCLGPVFCVFHILNPSGLSVGMGCSLMATDYRGTLVYWYGRKYSNSQSGNYDSTNHTTWPKRKDTKETKIQGPFPLKRVFPIAQQV